MTIEIDTSPKALRELATALADDGFDDIAKVIDALAAEKEAPIDMVLHCPSCGMQHIDEPDEIDPYPTPEKDAAWWGNPPHRSHLCHGCGHIWRPADVPTNGVAAVKTKGKADSPIPAEKEAAASQEPFAWTGIDASGMPNRLILEREKEDVEYGGHVPVPLYLATQPLTQSGEPPKDLGESIRWVLRPTGRTIPDLTGREHVCEWQSAVNRNVKNFGVIAEVDVPQPAPQPVNDLPTFYVSGPYFDGSMAVCRLDTGLVVHKFRLDGVAQSALRPTVAEVPLPEPYATLHHDCGDFTLKRRRPTPAPYRTETYTADQLRTYAQGYADAVVADARGLIEECQSALAEELAAWDIDPPIHHVKQAHDKCTAWLAGMKGTT